MADKNSELSLEELRKMDGKSVWVVKKHPYQCDLIPECCGVVSIRNNCVISARAGLFGFNHYGESWVAYHQKVGGKEMTRRVMVFKIGDVYLVSQEFNGDRSEAEYFFGHTGIKCDWPEVVELFEGVETPEEFREAVGKAEELYGYERLPLEAESELPVAEQVWVMSHGNLILKTRYGEPLVEWVTEAVEQFGFKGLYANEESVDIRAKNTDGRWRTWFTLMPDFKGVLKISGGGTDTLNIWLHETRPDMTPERCIEFFEEISRTLGLFGEDKLVPSDLIDPEDWQEIAGVHDAYEDERYTGKKEGNR